jgi:hypothetical protein
MPEICAIVENREASILGQNFFSVLPFTATPLAGLHGNLEVAEFG